MERERENDRKIDREKETGIGKLERKHERKKESKRTRQ